ncbi:MAG: aminotransferase class I/II-fold pyridoxal phosphate-dependent enzyme [Bacteroidota bacterium]|nr:aminotransferase class I/II-fold pyridoxal phosphate-dependent enzyme [Bacteroidota bacterium]
MNHKAIKHFASLCAGRVNDLKTTRPHQLPIYATSAFEFDSMDEQIHTFLNQPDEGHVYSRYGNPTVEAVAKRIADMEVFGSDLQAFGLLTSSGMSAIHITVHSLLKPGDHIFTQGNLYGGTTELFKRVFHKYGIEVHILDFKNLDLIRESFKKCKTQALVYIESPANPTLQCIDITEIGKISKEFNFKLIVDNTFCTPYCQKPLLLGADVVIHSTTKFLHGHGVSTGGAIIGTDASLIKESIWTTLKLTGCNSNPFDAWMLNIGLKTLHLRMERHSENATKLANYLEMNIKVNRVNYPGLPSHEDYTLAQKQMSLPGALLSFELKTELPGVIRFLDQLNLASLAPSLGETDTMVLHPASSSHLKIPRETRLKNGISDSLVRLSVGLEDAEDLIQDLEQAFLAT